MKAKLFYLTMALLLVLSLAAVIVPSSPAQAATILYVDDDNCPGPGTGTVGDPYCKIQYAVDNATSGDTISVAAGMYNEDITITKGLTLTTPQISPATIDGGIWIKDIHTYTDPITVKYFTIQNGAAIDGTHDYGIKISGDPGLADQAIVDMHIVHNTFLNVGKTDDVGAEMWWNAAVFYDANHFGALGSRYDTYFTGTGEISHNTIVNNLADPNQRTQLGIGLRSGLNMEINRNDISGNVAEGIHLWGPVYTGNTANHRVNHNTIDLSGWIGDPIGNNPRGIWSYARHTTYDYNTIITKWIGMRLSYWDDTNWGGVSAASYPIAVRRNVIHPPTGQSMTVGLFISGSNSQITENEIYGATNTAYLGAGITFQGWGLPEVGELTECKNNTFTGNSIHDNYDGITQPWGTPWDNTLNNVFRKNKIFDNSNYGMYNAGSVEIIDAEGNWWGSVDGPQDTDSGTTEVTSPATCYPVATMLNAVGEISGSLGDSVSDNVDYCPWRLITPAAECFIATAAYGTSTADQIDVLRDFRDQVLLKDALGSGLVTLYYQASPPLAEFLSQHSLLRTVVREVAIDPIVSLVKLTAGIWGD